MAKDVTIRDVAKLAGVSVSTVSLVLNQRPNVSPRMAARVQGAMRELEYKPIPRKEIIRPGVSRPRKTNRIALYLLGQPRVLLNSGIYSQVIAGAEEALRERGLSLLLGCVPRPEDFAREIARANFDGLLILGGYGRNEALAPVWRYPCVKLMGLPENDDIFDHICINEAATARLAADYLLARGHRQCAFFGRGVGPQRGGAFYLRKVNFCTRISEGGGQAADFVDDQIVEMGDDFHIIRHDKMGTLVDALLAAQPRPTGIMIDADTIAMSVYQCLLERGIRPGADLEIVSCNNERQVIASLNPPPAVVDTQSHDIGRRGVEQVLWRNLNRQSSRNVIIIEPTIVPGGKISQCNLLI